MNMNVSGLSSNSAQYPAFANSAASAPLANKIAHLPQNIADAINVFDRATSPLQRRTC